MRITDESIRIGSRDLTLQHLYECLHRLEVHRQRFRERWILLELEVEKLFSKKQRFIFMMKNKLGLTKDQAKKIFFNYRSGPQGEQQPIKQDDSVKEPETTEEKIELIMEYMKDTSAKLDQIESDISYLKIQIDQILKRL